MSYILRLAAVLGLITVVAAGALAYTNQLTAGQIAAQVVQAKEAALREVMPDAIAFVAQPEALAEAQAKDPILQDLTELYIADGLTGPVGAAFGVSVTGYGGPVDLMVGIDKDGRVTGVKIISSAGETPGLGAKIKEASFLGQFLRKDASAPLELTKGPASGDRQVQAIAAATISSSAVLRAVNSAAAMYRSLAGGGTDRLAALKLQGAQQLFPAPASIMEDPELAAQLRAQDPDLEGATDLYWAWTEDTLTGVAIAATGKGYGGPITAVVGFGKDGNITGVVLVDLAGETVGLGTLITQPRFINQFPGKPASPLTVTTGTAGPGQVEAVAGATVSSRGAVEAINNAIKLYSKLPPRN